MKHINQLCAIAGQDIRSESQRCYIYQLLHTFKLGILCGVFVVVVWKQEEINQSRSHRSHHISLCHNICQHLSALVRSGAADQC